jgi:hypothetical protein
VSPICLNLPLISKSCRRDFARCMSTSACAQSAQSTPFYLIPLPLPLIHNFPSIPKPNTKTTRRGSDSLPHSD